MRAIAVRRVIRADVATVWDALADIAAHVEWMADARAIRFTSSITEGVGTTFECDTKVGPLRLTDRMTVTEWDVDRAIAVRHVGTVTGEGRFTLRDAGLDRTELAWDETLELPWWIPELPAAVVLRSLWKHNLRRFEQTLGPSGPSSGERGVRRRPGARQRVRWRRRGG